MPPPFRRIGLVPIVIESHFLMPVTSLGIVWEQFASLVSPLAMHFRRCPTSDSNDPVPDKIVDASDDLVWRYRQVPFALGCSRQWETAVARVAPDNVPAG